MIAAASCCSTLLARGEWADALEKNGKKKELHIGKWKMPDGFMPQLIVLASIIAGAWVLVTILNLFQ